MASVRIRPIDHDDELISPPALEAAPDLSNANIKRQKASSNRPAEVDMGSEPKQVPPTTARRQLTQRQLDALEKARKARAKKKLLREIEAEKASASATAPGQSPQESPQGTQCSVHEAPVPPVDNNIHEEPLWAKSLMSRLDSLELHLNALKPSTAEPHDRADPSVSNVDPVRDSQSNIQATPSFRMRHAQSGIAKSFNW
jgi:hypothetical protein